MPEYIGDQLARGVQSFEGSIEVHWHRFMSQDYRKFVRLVLGDVYGGMHAVVHVNVGDKLLLAMKQWPCSYQIGVYTTHGHAP